MDKYEKMINARERYKALGMANTYGKTTEEKAELEAEYDKARREFLRAYLDANFTAMQG